MSADAFDPERTRRIQEEIRRKIAERRSGHLPPRPTPMPTERPLAPPVLAPRPTARAEGGLRERLERKLAEMREKAEAAAHQQQQRQRHDAERRAEAAEGAARAELQQRAAQAAAAREIAAKQAQATRIAAIKPASRWRDELRDPQSVRRAIVLREILGTPAGLR